MWPFAGSPAKEEQDVILDSTPMQDKQGLRRINASTTIEPDVIQTSTPLQPQSLSIESTIPPESLPYQRLNVDPIARIIYVSGVAGLAGFAKGFQSGANKAVLRYRAENAHLTPTSKAGWYLYNKSKNYHGVTGGVRAGVKAGVGYFGWTTLFLTLEGGLDAARGRVFAEAEDPKGGQADVFNTLSAAIAVAGMYSWWHGLDRFAASRMTKGALRLALPYGLGQDVLAWLKGEKVWYARAIESRIR